MALHARWISTETTLHTVFENTPQQLEYCYLLSYIFSAHKYDYEAHRPPNYFTPFKNNELIEQLRDREVYYYRTE